MVSPERIEYALDQTISAHPETTSALCGGLASQITTGINHNSYTRNNNAREMVSSMTQDDLLRYILREAIKAYNSASYFYYYDEKIQQLQTDRDKINYLLQTFPCFGELQKLIPLISNPEVNVSLYFKSNQNDLLALVNSVVDLRYKSHLSYRKYIDEHGLVETLTPNGQTINLFSKIDEDITKVASARNIQVNHRSVNKCLGELMSGEQLKNQRNEYALDGTLYASQDIGKRRNNQEDCTIILTHPENPEFKFLAVADGMGGVDKGEKASSYMISKITEWFNSLPADAYFYADNLQQSFNTRIAEISNEIYNQFNADFNRIVAGSTFVGAIVTQDRTIVSSVGDSRAYTMDGKNLNLITRDESQVWPPIGPTSKEALDDLRFKKGGNVITRCIGQPLNSIQSTVIRNEDYERLVLFSDGVTDLLSTDRIRFLCLNSPPELLTKYLVDEALAYDAVRLRGATEDYNGVVYAGKDNATATAYIRR